MRKLVSCETEIRCIDTGCVHMFDMAPLAVAASEMHYAQLLQLLLFLHLCRVPYSGRLQRAFGKVQCGPASNHYEFVSNPTMSTMPIFHAILSSVITELCVITRAF